MVWSGDAGGGSGEHAPWLDTEDPRRRARAGDLAASGGGEAPHHLDRAALVDGDAHQGAVRGDDHPVASALLDQPGAGRGRRGREGLLFGARHRPLRVS